MADTHPYRLQEGARVAVIGAEGLAGLYAGALTQRGADAYQKDGSALVLTGLTAAAALLRTE